MKMKWEIPDLNQLVNLNQLVKVLILFKLHLHKSLKSLSLVVARVAAEWDLDGTVTILENISFKVMQFMALCSYCNYYELQWSLTEWKWVSQHLM